MRNRLGRLVTHSPAPEPRTMQETIAITTAPLRNTDNEVVRTLEEKGYRVLCHPRATPPSREELLAYLADAVGLICGSDPLTREVLERAPKLRVISRHGVGYDSIDVDAATDLGILVTYIPDAMVDAVADLAL